ncbi:hypothetical protein NP233_g12619 [Leucocoprinus birnbaumii]|uniref:F-box domain-containing protein n=1 Tax=Leucocoprinus birnbaumii TaxID=56174 RepID=A0AAD5VG14_9AGAR|nr:hypothetical protein NP233_g12619 [Leucocoprinus birnbaumii]
MSSNTNFPKNLNIAPSFHSSFELTDAFAEDAQRQTIHDYGIAGRVWEAAYAMLLYIQPPPKLTFNTQFLEINSPRTIVELGSGTGVVAAAIARVTDRHEDLVIATDLPEVCPLLEKNLSASMNSSVLVRPLAWGNKQAARKLASELFSGPHARTPTHIICSDLVYFPELFAPLLRSLILLTSTLFIHDSLHPTIFISHKVRSLVKETPFWSVFGLWFDFTPVLVKVDMNRPSPDLETEDWQRFGEDADDILFLFAARRRIESLDWQVPDDDLALMAGHGAWNNDARKGDDTFESLLLMSSALTVTSNNGFMDHTIVKHTLSLTTDWCLPSTCPVYPNGQPRFTSLSHPSPSNPTRSSLMPATTLSDLPAEVIHQILCELDEETLLVVSELDQCINRLALQAFFGATQGGTQLDTVPPSLQIFLTATLSWIAYGRRARANNHTIRVFCLSIKIDTQSSGRISLKEEIWGPSTRDGDKLMFELQELVDLVISKGCQKILVGTPDKDYFPPSRLSSSQVRSVLLKHTLAAQTLKLKDYTLWGSPFLGPTALSYNLNLLEQCTNTMHRLELNTEGVTRSNSKLKALLSGLLNDIHLPNLKYFLLTTKTRLIQYSYLIWFLSRHHGLAGLHIANNWGISGARYILLHGYSKIPTNYLQPLVPYTSMDMVTGTV